MTYPIVKYGHPVLRKKGEPIEHITPEIKRLIAAMFETMASFMLVEHANGVHETMAAFAFHDALDIIALE